MIMQLVSLTEGGERVKMSKRAGAIVTLDDLLDEIGVDAARWFLASRSPRLDARARPRAGPQRVAGQPRLLRAVRARADRVDPAQGGRGARGSRRSRPTCARARSSFHPSARALVKRLLELPGEIREAAERRAPHRITAYATETAQDFSAFYRDCRVVGAAEEGGDEDVRIAICGAREARARAGARPRSGSRRRTDVRLLPPRCGSPRSPLRARAARSRSPRPRRGARPLRADEGAARAGPGEVRPRLRAAARAGARDERARARARHERRRGRHHAGRARHRAAGAAHAGLDRRPPRAGVRGHRRCSRSGDPAAAQDYYLGFQYRRVAGEDAKFVADWGLKLQLADLRSVVRRARRGRARRDPRRPLRRRLDRGGVRGLGLRRPPGLPRPRRPRADRRRAAAAASRRPTWPARSASWRTSAPATSSSTCSASGFPEINGIFAQVGALWAYKRPDEPSVLQEYPLLPAFLKPPVRVTNEAQFGYAFDETTSPDSLALIHIRAGRLADAGDPRGWAGRRAHADPALRAGLRGRRAERDRVVLPAPPAARHRRREPAAPDAGGALPRPAADARRARSTCRSTPSARPHARARGARRAAAGAALADRAVRRSSTTAATSHLDPLSAAPAQEPLPEDGRAVPEAAARAR